MIRRIQVLLAGLIVWVLLQGYAEAETSTNGAGVHVLSGGQLRVEVMDPTAPTRYYQGNRFSSIANVLQVTMNRHDFLYSPIAHDPLKENGGLAMEFDLKQWPEGGPPGFEQAVQGDVFVKVGVGLLKKEGADYAFYKPYETVVLAPVEVTWGADCASFRQLCTSPTGYGYELNAKVDVQAQTVKISYRLENTGERAFGTEQYAHNFFSFDRALSGPSYELAFSSDFVLNGGGLLSRSGQRLMFSDFVRPEKTINAVVTMSSGGKASEDVTVRNREKKMNVRASVSRPTSRVAIHVASAYVCPEQFVRIYLKPGESAEWVRSYEFHAEATTAPERSRTSRPNS